MRATILLSLSAALLLGGCGAVPRQQPDSAAPAKVDAEKMQGRASEEGLELGEVAAIRPDSELSGPLLFDLLVAEMSAQQGNMAQAAASYYRVAVGTGDGRLAQRSTQLAVYARDFGLALQAAQLWGHLEPRSHEAQQSLAALLVGHGRLAEAEAPLRVLLEVQAGSEGFEAVVQVLARADAPDEALAMIARLAEAFPGRDARMAHARLAAHLGALDVAQTQLQALLAEDLDDEEAAQALLLLARVQFDLGQPEAGLDSMARAVALVPDNTEVRRRYAGMLIDQQRLAEAREQFEALLRLQGDEPAAEVLKALGLLAAEQGQLDDAEGYMRRLAGMEEFADEGYFSLGTIEERRGDWQAAVDWYEQVEGPRNRIKAQLRTVQLLREHRGAEAALEHLRATAPHSEDDEVLLALGEAELLEAMERDDEAMERLNMALESMPHSTDLLYTRAMLGERMGFLDVLERDLRTILSLDPENAEALNALGYTLADRTERYQEAMELIEKALALKPDDAAVLDSMGWVLYRLGRLDEALEYLRKAATLMDDGEVAAHLGEVLWQMGEHEQARRVWDEAQGYESGQETLKKTLERFQP